MISTLDWAAFASGLIGAVIGASATLGAVWLTQRREVERDRMADSRRLRDAKAERIRTDSAVLALVVDTLQYVAKQGTVLWPGVLAKTAEPLGPAMMRLELETGAESLVKEYKAVYKAFIAFRIAAEANERDPGSYGISEMVEHLPTLESGVQGIIAAAKAHLQKLEKPV